MDERRRVCLAAEKVLLEEELVGTSVEKQEG